MTPGRNVWTLAVLALAMNAFPAQAGTIQITMDDLVFAPAESTATVGDTIEWINKDILDHTATARNGDWDVTITANRAANLVLNKAGTIEYYCRYHPNMTGRIVIRPKE